MPYFKEYYLENRKKILERHKRNKESDPEKRRHQQRLWNYKHRLKKMGVTEEWFDETLKSQKGKCAICDKQFDKIIPQIDHCHKTGKLRGILCFSCNTGLGHFSKWQDNGFIDIFTKYLKNKH